MFVPNPAHGYGVYVVATRTRQEDETRGRRCVPYRAAFGFAEDAIRRNGLGPAHLSRRGALLSSHRCRPSQGLRTLGSLHATRPAAAKAFPERFGFARHFKEEQCR